MECDCSQVASTFVFCSLHGAKVEGALKPVEAENKRLKDDVEKLHQESREDFRKTEEQLGKLYRLMEHTMRCAFAYNAWFLKGGSGCDTCNEAAQMIIALRAQGC